MAFGFGLDLGRRFRLNPGLGFGLGNTAVSLSWRTGDDIVVSQETAQEARRGRHAEHVELLQGAPELAERRGPVGTGKGFHLVFDADEWKSFIAERLI